MLGRKWPSHERAVTEKDHNEILTVGEYIIRHTKDGDYVIGCRDGEAMQTPREKFERLIDDFYRREF